MMEEVDMGSPVSSVKMAGDWSPFQLMMFISRYLLLLDTVFYLKDFPVKVSLQIKPSQRRNFELAH